MLNNTVKIADFDCALYRKICRSYSVENYPTFMWIDNGEIIDSIPKSCSTKKLVDFALDKSSKGQKSAISGNTLDTVDNNSD